MGKLNNDLITLIDDIEFYFSEFNNIKTKCDYKTLLAVRKSQKEFSQIKDKLLYGILLVSSGKTVNITQSMLDFAIYNDYIEFLDSIQRSLKDIFFDHYNKFPSSDLLRLIYDEQGYNSLEIFEILELKRLAYRFNKLSASLTKSKFRSDVKEQITYEMSMLKRDLDSMYYTALNTVETSCKERNLDEVTTNRMVEIFKELTKEPFDITSVLNKQKKA